MNRFREYIIYGFALFSMFFGSGNLVFPLQIGMNAGSHWGLGFVGLLLTGVLLPFLGLFVIKLHHGSYDEFFGQAGAVARVVLPLFTLSLLGAFGVIPRCITVAHGGIESIFPSFSLFLFSLLFCIICFFICLKDSHIISILGKWITPIMLGCLMLLVVGGIYYAPSFFEKSVEPLAVFSASFQRGYKTMDLFAAFFFASFMFQYMQVENSRAISKYIPSIIGAGLLGLVYLGLVYLGAAYAPIISTLSPEKMLPTISEYILGQYATLVIGILIVFACLSTAIALNNIYARYLCRLLKIRDHYYALVLFGTTGVSFMISLLDFQGIAVFLEPVLDVSYPGIIALTFLSIITRGWKKLKMVSFYGILFLIMGRSFL